MAEPLFPDRALQDAYQALMKGHPGAGHVDEHTWDQIVGEEIDPAARDAAFDHVIQCEDCSRVWRGILTLRSEAETQGLIPPAARASSRRVRQSLMSGSIARCSSIGRSARYASAASIRTSRSRTTPSRWAISRRPRRYRRVRRGRNDGPNTRQAARWRRVATRMP